ncbi:uncharacterized protein [Leptinotarsa decemlineata]|uniref:uncharacterized protein n=1 Tax=Leptinotarsa decemlineata TaxID=7539 RepID=UPI003D307AD2
MHSMHILLLTSVLIFHVGCGNVVDNRRYPRGIRGTYTSTVVDTSVVTSLVPSSCVQVDATLPPCRIARFLHFPYFNANSQLLNNGEKEDNSSRSELNPQAWGEYFGFYAPTVTVTLTKLETTIVQDPRVVVTYAIKGCKPLTIPSDLDRCPPDSSTISIEEILPTSTVIATSGLPTASPVSNQGYDVKTVVQNEPELDTSKNVESIDQHPNVEVESSNEKVAEDLETAKPTEALPF